LLLNGTGADLQLVSGSVLLDGYPGQSIQISAHSGSIDLAFASEVVSNNTVGRLNILHQISMVEGGSVAGSGSPEGPPSNPGADGIGSGIDFFAFNDAATDQETGRIDAVLTDVTNASEDSVLNFYVVKDGALTLAMTIDENATLGLGGAGGLNLGGNAITNVGNVDGVDVSLHDHVGGGTDGATVDHEGLAGTEDDDHQQYLLASGARALGGDLSLGTNSITNAAAITATGIVTGDSFLSSGPPQAAASGSGAASPLGGGSPLVTFTPETKYSNSSLTQQTADESFTIDVAGGNADGEDLVVVADNFSVNSSGRVNAGSFVAAQSVAVASVLGGGEEGASPLEIINPSTTYSADGISQTVDSASYFINVADGNEDPEDLVITADNFTLDASGTATATSFVASDSSTSLPLGGGGGAVPLGGATPLPPIFNPNTAYSYGGLAQTTPGESFTIDVAGGDGSGEDLVVVANNFSLSSAGDISRVGTVDSIDISDHQHLSRFNESFVIQANPTQFGGGGNAHTEGLPFPFFAGPGVSGDFLTGPSSSDTMFMVCTSSGFITKMYVHAAFSPDGNFHNIPAGQAASMLGDEAEGNASPEGPGIPDQTLEITLNKNGGNTTMSVTLTLADHDGQYIPGASFAAGATPEGQSGISVSAGDLISIEFYDETGQWVLRVVLLKPRGSPSRSKVSTIRTRR